MAQSTALVLRPEALTREAWEPFGWLPVEDTDPRDGASTLSYEWADPHLNVISHRFDEIHHTPSGAVVDTLYRHETHTQALMPLNVRGIIAVAPASIDTADDEQRSALRAFVLDVQQCLVLARSTWHWGPFPFDADTIKLLNVQGRRYAEDNVGWFLPPGQILVANP